MPKKIYSIGKTPFIIAQLNNFLVEELSVWYSLNKRDLPWRTTSDPYHIWLSEIILQQTRVNQGLNYYFNFISTFPKVSDLANAPEDQVLRLWQGLGYYNRARNLQISAKFVHEELNNVFPDNYNDLLKLKGVGDYTASAIASFAFNEKVAVLDGNVFRVLARFFGVHEDIALSSSRKVFKDILDKILPATGKSCHIFNQAIMEFGAMLCSPKKPKCEFCPLREACFAYENKEQQLLPIKIKKLKVRVRHIYYLIVRNHKGEILMQKRDASDVWAGLYDFPLVENDKGLDEMEICQSILGKYEISVDKVKILHSAKKHQLSHQSIFAHFIELSKDELPLKNNELKSFDMDEVNELPKPIHINKFLKEFYF